MVRAVPPTSNVYKDLRKSNSILNFSDQPFWDIETDNRIKKKLFVFNNFQFPDIPLYVKSVTYYDYLTILSIEVNCARTVDLSSHHNMHCAKKGCEFHVTNVKHSEKCMYNNNHMHYKTSCNVDIYIDKQSPDFPMLFFFFNWCVYIGFSHSKLIFFLLRYIYYFVIIIFFFIFFLLLVDFVICYEYY